MNIPMKVMNFILSHRHLIIVLSFLLFLVLQFLCVVLIDITLPRDVLDPNVTKEISSIAKLSLKVSKLCLKIDSARAELKDCRQFLLRDSLSFLFYKNVLEHVDSTQKDFLAWWDIFKQDHSFENAAIEAKLAEDRKIVK